MYAYRFRHSSQSRCSRAWNPRSRRDPWSGPGLWCSASKSSCWQWFGGRSHPCSLVRYEGSGNEKLRRMQLEDSATRNASGPLKHCRCWITNKEQRTCPQSVQNMRPFRGSTAIPRGWLMFSWTRRARADGFSRFATWNSSHSTEASIR